MPVATTPINKPDNFKVDKKDYVNERLFVNKSNSYIENKFTEIIDVKKSIIPEIRISKPRISASINNTIQKSQYLLDLKDNWDEGGAMSINKTAYNNAISFLTAYSERIVDVYGEDKDYLLTPSISPVKDGSVDLEWNLKNSYLLINFTDSKEDFVYYYLAFKDDDKISLDANGQVERKKINDKFASQLIDLS